DLPGASLHQAATHPDMVVEVEQLDHRPGLGAQLVGAEIDLQPAGGILHMPEADLALGPPGLDPPGDRYRGTRVAHLVPVEGERVGGGVAALEAPGEGPDAEGLQCGALLPPVPLRLAQLLAHAAFPPNRFRN